MNSYDLLIIGAGPAGCMAAITAAENGKRVLLLDKNEKIGRKLLITGKGRCNVTNNCDVREFIRHVRTNPRFLYSALSAFTPDDTIAFFENAGVPLKTERGNRVFPVSDKASDIVDALYRKLRSPKITRKTATVERILCEDGNAVGVTADGENFFAENVLLATGGKSYPLTGSDGSGYRLAQQLGHTVVPLQPSLIPIVAKNSWCKELQGLSLKNVTLTLTKKGAAKPVFSELGEMLFTHFGISGPLVLSASSCMNIRELPEYRIEIDLKPALSEKQLDDRLLRDFGKYLNRDLSNALHDLLPQKMIPVILSLSGLSHDLKVNQITKEQRATLADNLKHLTVIPAAFRPIEEAIVTAGGIDVNEVDPRTMQSKKIGHLLFAGEILDVDAFTGGYNLQIAFSTGFLAANHL